MQSSRRRSCRWSQFMSLGPDEAVRAKGIRVGQRPTASARAGSACTAARWTTACRRCCRRWPCTPWPWKWPGCRARRWQGSSVATAVAQISPCRLTIVAHSILPENSPPASPSTPGAARSHFFRSSAEGRSRQLAGRGSLVRRPVEIACGAGLGFCRTGAGGVRAPRGADNDSAKRKAGRGNGDT